MRRVTRRKPIAKRAPGDRKGAGRDGNAERAAKVAPTVCESPRSRLIYFTKIVEK